MTPPPEAPAPHAHPYRWAVLAGVWLIYFSFGVMTFAIAPLVGPIGRDLGLGYTAMGSILGAWQLVYIGAAIPCGAFIDRVGLKWSLALAAVLMAASGAARAVAVDHLTMFLAVGLFGIGGPLISIGAPKAVAQWFKGPERGFAMGLYITGPALGSIVALAMTNSVFMPLADGDWRAVMLVYAAAVLATGVVWYALGAHPANRAAEAGHSRRGSLAEQIGVFAHLLRLPAVVLLLVMSVGIFFFNHGIGNWLPEILRAGGMDAATAGVWAAVPVALGIVGSLVLPRLATPPRRFAILLGLFVCIALAAGLLFFSAPPVLAAAMAFQGMSRGSLMAIATLVLMETRGVESQHMGAAGGLFFATAEIGGVLGPFSIGALSDATGGFAASLWLLVAIGGVLMLLLLAHRAAERRASPGGSDLLPLRSRGRRGGG